MGTYWDDIGELLGSITDRRLEFDVSTCLLHWFPHTTKTKVTSKFIDLGLLLAKREITHWKSQEGPSIRRWKVELVKWAESEGTIRMQQTPHLMESQRLLLLSE